MWHHKRSSKQLDRDMGYSNSIEVRVLVGWSVGHAIRSILREIVHKIKVVGLRYTVHKRHKLLGMLVRAFLVFMQHWITTGHTIGHLSLRWMISFVIKLFIFWLTLDLIISILVLTWWISVV